MKHQFKIFIALCLVICLIPSVGMIFFPTTRTTENKAMAEAPRLMTEEGTRNTAFISDFEDYFTQHIALRNEMVYMDALIQTSVFQESNVSGVIDGTDGWLYYSSTLDDYLGLQILSDRQLYNLAHNFSVVQEYVESQGMDFTLTIAPNKNTLYGENMPYYKSMVVDSRHNAILLEPFLSQQGIRYLDLFRMFDEQEEILYLKRDSHWNMKGACLAYNGIMDSLGLSHEDYSGTEPVLVKNENGDLNKMLYSFYGPLEENYDYALPQDYAYDKADATVEDGWIVTENESGEGTLLMFRDSFANTLIPFMSNEFATACYSNGQPNALERFVETHEPDCVVIQKVERNIAEYLDNPPVLTPPQVTLPNKLTIATTDSAITAEACMTDTNYYAIRGTVDTGRLEDNSELLVRVDDVVYRAYQTGENGFLLYLKQEGFTDASAQMRVYIVNPDTCVEVLSSEVTLP